MTPFPHNAVAGAGAPAATRRANLPRWRTWLGPALVVLAAFVLRAAYYDAGYGHPDETITVEVVGQMRRSGDWDTNWAKAPALEPALRYDQYNFSSHLYGTFFFYRAVKWVPGLEAWRSRDQGFWVYRFFSVLLATAAVAQAWWLARRLTDARTALAAASLVAVLPLLVQDAHYARPEAFVTLLTLVAVTLSLPGGRAAGVWRTLGAAVVVGLLVACKFSLLALAWLPLVAMAADPARRTATRLALGVGVTVVGISLGFALGVPGAMAHPGVFWHGVKFLTTQYAGLHPPHSHVDGGPVAGLLGGYFLSTLGGGFLATLAGGIARWAWARRWTELALVAGPVALFAAYFSTRTVFFERNLSHVAPLACVLAAAGIAGAGEWLARMTGARAAVVIAALLAAVLWRPAELTSRLVWTVFPGRGGELRAAREERIRAEHPGLAWREDALLNTAPLSQLAEHFASGGAPLLMRVIDYNDEWSARYGPMLPAEFDTKLLATDASVFADVPGCTLHTYGSWTDRIYLVRGTRRVAAER